MKDIWKILLSGRSENRNTTSKSSSPVDSSDERILKQAFLLSKSVPRRSNCAKYKEESGHAPTMYTNEDDGKLLVRDIVLTRTESGDVRKHIEVKELMLGNVDDTVHVKDKLCQLENVLVSSLLKDKGLIFIIPSTMYKLENKTIKINEIALQVFQDCVDSLINSIYTDEEISELSELSAIPYRVGNCSN